MYIRSNSNLGYGSDGGADDYTQYYDGAIRSSRYSSIFYSADQLANGDDA